jgi:small subunit ribosomal protein S10
MAQNTIRVRLKAYDHRIIDQSCQKIIEAAIQTGAKVVGPVPFPTHREKFSVQRSPFTDKDSREDFAIKTHKRLIDISNPTQKTIDSLMHMELPAGVDIQIGA